MKKIDIDLKCIIEENEKETQYLKHYTSDSSRDEMITDIYGELSCDASIAHDREYLGERIEEEIREIDRKIESDMRRLAHLKKQNLFLRALLNTSVKNKDKSRF